MPLARSEMVMTTATIACVCSARPLSVESDFGQEGWYLAEARRPFRLVVVVIVVARMTNMMLLISYDFLRLRASS